MVDRGVEVLSPQSAWDLLKSQNSAALVDVRSRAEWSFVGVPDLSPVGKQVVLAEWRSFPGMAVNPRFVEELEEGMGDPPPSDILFICRSGARSMEAATITAERLNANGHAVRCHNVAEGFEGDLDAESHRGAVSGWKARGLPWRQS
ncbi:MAG: rhodanese-like domain-containing protein [Pseudomonadota bacterium]